MFNSSANDSKNKALAPRPPVRELMTTFRRSAVDTMERNPLLPGLAASALTGAAVYGLGGTVLSTLMLSVPAFVGLASAAENGFRKNGLASLFVLLSGAIMVLGGLVYAVGDHEAPNLTDVQKLSLNRIGAQVISDKPNYKHTFRVVGAETTTQLADGKIIEFHKPIVEIQNDTPHPLYRNKKTKTSSTLKLEARAGKMPDATPAP